MKNYNEQIDEGYFLEVDAQSLENLHQPHHDLQFLPEGMNIENAKKLVANLHDKSEYVVHIRNLKQVLNNGFEKNTFLKKKKSFEKIS